MDVIYKRVAGLDVHKVVPSGARPGRRQGRARVQGPSNDDSGLSALPAWLTEARSCHVAVEATGFYCEPNTFSAAISNSSLLENHASASRCASIPGPKRLCWLVLTRMWETIGFIPRPRKLALIRSGPTAFPFQLLCEPPKKVGRELTLARLIELGETSNDFGLPTRQDFAVAGKRRKTILVAEVLRLRLEALGVEPSLVGQLNERVPDRMRIEIRQAGASFLKVARTEFAFAHGSRSSPMARKARSSPRVTLDLGKSGSSRPKPSSSRRNVTQSTAISRISSPTGKNQVEKLFVRFVGPPASDRKLRASDHQARSRRRSTRHLLMQSKRALSARGRRPQTTSPHRFAAMTRRALREIAADSHRTATGRSLPSLPDRIAPPPRVLVSGVFRPLLASRPPTRDSVSPLAKRRRYLTYCPSAAPVLGR